MIIVKYYIVFFSTRFGLKRVGQQMSFFTKPISLIGEKSFRPESKSEFSQTSRT